MKRFVIALVILLTAAPAYAQLGSLRRKAEEAKKVADKAKKISDIHISDKEERAIGDSVSLKIRNDFGVYQNAEVTKYVSLVGSVLAQASKRPSLNWQFIVLDTDGVNAYAAPGGLVHITRGLLGLIKDEAELAGVLGHEITHITEKHTVNAIQKAGTIQFTADEVGGDGLTGAAVDKIANGIYAMIFENKFDRSDEMEADKVGITVANKVGYNPAGLNGVLQKLADRNKDRKEPNGLFASHPQLAERIEEMGKIIKKDKLAATATVATRYTQNITFDAKPAAAIAMVDRGARGLAGEESKPAEKEEKPKGKGFAAAAGSLTKGSQAQNQQNVASAGARGTLPDRDARGGSNPALVRIPLTPAEIDAFKKGIAG